MTVQGPVASATQMIGRRRKNEEVSAADPYDILERILLDAHRIAVSLGELGAFRGAQISVAEWAVLKSLAGRKNVLLRELSLASGVSRQRFRKIVAELEAKGLVVTDQSGGEDKRIREISATPMADHVLSSISLNMRTLFDEDLLQRRSRSLLSAEHSLERIAKAIRRMWFLRKQAEKNRRVGVDGAD